MPTDTENKGLLNGDPVIYESSAHSTKLVENINDDNNTSEVNIPKRIYKHIILVSTSLFMVYGSLIAVQVCVMIFIYCNHICSQSVKTIEKTI